MTARQRAWLLVAVLWPVALLNYTDRQVVFSVFPLLSSQLGLSNVQLGLLSTVFLWVYGILSPISGFIADRFGRARAISIGLLVWSGVTFATGLAGNFAQLLCARALMGISEACYLPAALAKIAEQHGPKTRSLATGFHQTGLYIGMIVGGGAGGWLGQRYGWKMPFLLLGCIGIAYFAVVFLFFRRDTAVPGREENTRGSFASSVAELFHLDGFPTMVAVFSATSAANWLVYTWLPVYIFERFKVSLAAAGFTATFYIQIASLAGILTGGWLADRFSAKTSRARLFTQAAGVFLAGPFLFLLGYAKSYSLLLATLIIFGAGRGFYECNTMPVLCQIARDDLRSTGFGLFNLAGCLVGGLAAVVAGALKNILGLSNVFQIAAAILFLSGWLLLRIRPTMSPSNSPGSVSRLLGNQE
jgi:MFS transporter, Spinster family, sphingosine-1-phosphate transporter